MRTDDGYLISKCLAGEPEAFGLLVDKYKPAIYGFAYAKLRDFQDAEELAQDVFLRAYQKLHALKRWDSFSAWLYAIASNLCKKQLQSRARRLDCEYIEDQEASALRALSLEAYHRQQEHETLHEAMAELPEVYREVLSLYYLSGMSRREIARFLGTTTDTIKSRLRRARAKLNEEMITTMTTTFEEMRLQPAFTFRVMEAVQRIKIQPAPHKTALPFGVSATLGLLILMLSLTIPQSPLYRIGQLIGSALPSQTQVLDEGEIAVDAMQIDRIISLSPEMNDGDLGKKPLPEPTPMFGGGKWERRADMPTERAMCAASVIDGKIYVVGGWKTLWDPAPLATLEIYDPATDKWAKGADMPTPRGGLVTAVVDGVLYAIGGGGNTVSLTTVEAYHTRTNRWEKKAKMKTPRAFTAAAVVDGKIYVIGGATRQGAHVPTVEMYDPVTNTWTPKASLSLGTRAVLSAVVVDGKIYAIGGDPPGGATTSTTVEMYDPTGDTWTQKANMSTAKGGSAAVAVNGKIYVIGGATAAAGRALSIVEVYDPATDTWTTCTDMPAPRSFLAADVVNGKIYAFGGSAMAAFPVVLLSTVEEYTPEAWQPFAVSPQDKLATTWGEVKAEQ